MGYCMSLEESTASFKRENAKKVLKAIQDLHGKETIEDSSGSHFSWVDNNFYEIKDIEKMFEEWRWKIEEEGDNYKVTKFLGEKSGDEEALFQAIALYMNDGHIMMRGEDGAIWKWRFKNGKCKEMRARIMFDDDFHIDVD